MKWNPDPLLRPVFRPEQPIQSNSRKEAEHSSRETIGKKKKGRRTLASELEAPNIAMSSREEADSLGLAADRLPIAEDEEEEEAAGEEDKVEPNEGVRDAMFELLLLLPRRLIFVAEEGAEEP